MEVGFGSPVFSKFPHFPVFFGNVPKAEALYSFASPDRGWCLAKKKARPRHVRVASFTKNLPGIFPWETAGWIVWAVICHICHCSHVPGGRKIIPFSHKRNAAICIMQMCKFSLVNSFGKRESNMFGSRKRMPQPENIFDVFPSISISSALRANRECLKGRSLSWTFLFSESKPWAEQGLLEERRAALCRGKA